MSEQKETAELWEFVPLYQFRMPPEPAGETVRKGIRSLWGRIWAADQDRAGPAADQLDAAQGGLLNRVAAEPGWEAAADALARRFQDGHAVGSPLAVVGPPGCASTALRTVAQSKKWPVVAAPDTGQILSGGEEFVQGLKWISGKPLVVLQLEKFFLRQHDGLDLIRRLLDRLLQEQKPVLVQCGSWAWTFLLMAVRIDGAVGEAISLQAFDAQRLQVWLRELADCSVQRPMQFLQADNGAPVLPPASGCAVEPGGETEKSGEPSGFLKNLASFARGNPGVALQVWRRCLGISRESTEDASSQDESEAQDPNTIWVTPWSSVKLPSTSSAGKDELFILNALLTHDGLGLQELRHVLGDSSVELRRKLGKLREGGVLVRENDVWSVSPVAYPGVREHLRSEGFLVDAF